MTRPTFHLIPHTHWDREWYLSRAAFEARLVPAVNRVLALLERNHELRFHLDGQAVLIEDYLAIEPDTRTRVEKLVRDRRLTIGPWYVLADELIPSGESLLRNLLIGRAIADRLGGGGGCEVFYSPDAFGHPAAGPLLAREFGIGRAVLWRGVPNGGGRDLIRWDGLAGRSVLALHLPPDGYEGGAVLVGAEGQLDERWSALRARLLSRAAGADLAILVGADHHAPHDRLLDLADRLRRLDPDCTFRVSTLDEYFAAVERTPPSVTSVSGELRAVGHAWSLQGVHGTRARLKRLHGATELALQRLAEPLVALAGEGHGVLSAAWRRLVESQFHDTIAGCCADSVAAEQMVRLEGVVATSRELTRQSIHRLVGHDPDQAREVPARTAPTLVLWNPAPRPRGGVVIAEITSFREDVLIGPPGDRAPRRGQGFERQALVAPDGTVLPVQVLSVRSGLERVDAPSHYPELDRVDRVSLAFEAPVIGGLAAGSLTTRPGAARIHRGRHRVRHQAGTLSNGIVSIRWGRDGGLTLIDLVRGQAYHGLLGLEDRADRGDSYTPEIDATSRERVRVAGIDTLATGPLVGAIAVRWALVGPTGSMTGRTAASLHAQSPIVRIRIDLDNNAPDHRLRLRLPIGIEGDSVAGAAFSAVRRPPGVVDRAWPEETKLPTDPAHRFVAAARGDRGLTLLAPGFFEYQWTPAGDLYYTLLRAVGELSKANLATRRGHAGWVTPTPGAQELGRHRTELGLVPVDEATTSEPDRLVQHWEDAFLPPLPLWLRDGLPSRRATPGVELSGPGLVMEAMKPAETGDAIVLRAVNLGAQPTHGVWRFETPIRQAHRVRADETTVAPMMLSPDCRALTFDAGPGELVSIRVSPALEAIRDQGAGDHHQH